MDLGNTFDTERPNYVPNAPGCNNNLYANQSPTQWFNEACFQASTYGTVGNAGKEHACEGRAMRRPILA